MSQPQLKARTVAIIPGFAEGPWHCKRLLAAFERLGYSTESDPKQAELVIGHSAGCFYLHADATSQQKVVLIGPPFWPGKSVRVSFFQKAGADIGACMRRGTMNYLAQKTLWNIVYILRDLPRTFAISRAAGRHDFHHAITASETLIVRNDQDSFCTPEITSLLADTGKFRFASIPGQHDDCWLDSNAHAKLIIKSL